MVATEGSGGGNSSIEGIGIPDLSRRLRESSEKGTDTAGGLRLLDSTDGVFGETNQNGRFESVYFQQTEESKQFRQEHEMRKMKQVMDRQVPLMDEINTKGLQETILGG
ncbi:Syntaxin-71 [Acorus calamus]|uniref:Syntaxin-71 n=1 Tax=Acorus calamus TaxID=4465 RepID=A0AAV9C9R6_ACOCL|nr:Syntaxin-71 [Acorus calamus]